MVPSSLQEVYRYFLRYLDGIRLSSCESPPIQISSPTQVPAGIGYPTFHWISRGTSCRLRVGVVVREAKRIRLQEFSYRTSSLAFATPHNYSLFFYFSENMDYPKEKVNS